MPITVIESPETRSDPRTPAAGRRERLRRSRRVSIRRPFLVLLVLGGCLGLALVTLAAVLAAGRDVTETLVEPEATSADLGVALTVTSVDVEAGEVHLRLVPSGGDTGRVAGGVVTEGFRILVNDVGGASTHTFTTGEPLRPIDFAVSLTGGSAFRYPFDRYDASVIILVVDGVRTTEGAPLRVIPAARSAASSYTVRSDIVDCGGLGGTCLEMDVRRPVSTVGYAVWFVVLVWALALAGLGVLYVVVRRGVELPLWAFGYLVGVLFALPPLRASLPTPPPFGGFVDFVAYYWAVAVVGLTLIALISLWIRENRRL